MVPPHRARFRGRPRGRLRGRAHGTRTAGGGVPRTAGGGCPIPPFHCSLSLFGLFVLDRPTRTAPAERGETGATPPFSPLARFGKGGGVLPSVPPGVPSPPRRSGRSLPSVCIPAGRLPGPRAGRTIEPRRAAPCLTDSSARSWSSAASVSGAPGRGPARFPRPIPWRSSCPTTTPRTRTAPSSRGTTWRPAWRCSTPANFSSAHPGSGSPGWASVWGAGPAGRAGPFRLRADGPAIVVGEVHHPVRAIESPAPEWLTIPGAGPLYRRGDFRGRWVRQDVRVYAPVRAPALRLASDESRAARGGACP